MYLLVYECMFYLAGTILRGKRRSVKDTYTILPLSSLSGRKRQEMGLVILRFHNQGLCDASAFQIFFGTKHNSHL
jgi:hypothetical protein